MGWTTTSDGLEIYYEDSRAAGPALVFQSGFMGIHDIWKHQVAELGAAFRCITHDNRGHGLSSSPADEAMYSTQKNADDLRAVLDATGLAEPFVLVTHSMGSANAVAFALQHPELVRGILMLGGAHISGEAALKRGGHPDMFASRNLSPVASFQFFTNFGLDPAIAMEAAKWPRHVFRNQTAALLGFSPGDLGRLNMRILVVHGTDDVITPVEVPQDSVRQLPNAALKMLAGVNHFPQTENPSAVNAIIREFEQGLPR